MCSFVKFVFVVCDVITYLLSVANEMQVLVPLSDMININASLLQSQPKVSNYV